MNSTETVKIKYVAFDPGVTTGFASFDENGNDVGENQLRTDDLFMFLAMIMEIRRGAELVFIIEDYRLDPNRVRSQLGKRNETEQAIGAIKLCALFIGAEIVIQPNTVKPVAERWSGRKAPKEHSISHAPDAYNHGVYYLVKNKIRPSRLEMELRKRGSSKAK